MLLAQRAHPGLDALVLEHGEVGEDVVLDLVVEPEVEVVVEIAAGAVVGAADDLLEVALALVLRLRVEAIQVLAEPLVSVASVGLIS